MSPATPNPVIPLNRPQLLEEDLQLVAESLRSGPLSAGPRTAEFEQLVAERTRRPHAISLCSGAMAIEVTLRAIGVGPGDEVLVPALTFFGTAGLTNGRRRT